MEKLDQNIKALVERGKRKGYLTYEEMNRSLPAEGISPDRLDSLLMTIDELGIELFCQHRPGTRGQVCQFADQIGIAFIYKIICAQIYIVDTAG